MHSNTRIGGWYGLLALSVGLSWGGNAWAYPEFQKFIAKNSGRPVNCAMCHVHHDGPEGTAPGQIGNLSAAEQDRLGRARAALQPGASVDSPILNRFGNHIIHNLGKTKFLELRLAPAELAKALPSASDLDGDGIPDVQEFLAGTLPTDRNDGKPQLLFIHNLQSHGREILLAGVAAVLSLYGLAHLARGFRANSHPADEEV